MPRRHQISVVQLRAGHLLAGDIINRRGHVSEGWFEVARVEPMPSGEVLVTDEKESQAFLMRPLDIVWVQIVAVLDGNSHLAL